MLMNLHPTLGRVHWPDCTIPGAVHPLIEPTPDQHPLHALGWKSALADAESDGATRGVALGRVVAVERGWDQVATAAGVVATSRATAAFRRARFESPPAVGDWVFVASEASDRAIVEIVARAGTIVRRDPARPVRSQVVVANVDRALFAFAADHPISARRVERCLVLARDGGVQPALALTRIDLVSADQLAHVHSRLQEAAPGVEILEISTLQPDTIESLRRWVAAAGTVALLGASGVGKSTLSNALLGADGQATAEVRAGDGRGRHTTTTRRMLVVPGGGVVIDTPGLRALGLWADEGDGVDEAFPDILALGARCRFRNCSHRDEPGCAVAAAVKRGTLERQRYRGYLTLEAELGTLDRQRAQQGQRRGGRPPRAPRLADEDYSEESASEE